MSPRTVATAVALALATAVPAPVQGQSPLRVSGGATLAQLRVRSVDPAANESLRAPALGLEGSVTWHRLALRARYAEARLPRAPSNIEERDTVEGEIALAVRTWPWLQAGTAIHGRSYQSPTRRQRWVWWDLFLAGNLSILSDAVHGYAELRRAITADVNVAERWDYSAGGEVGMLFALPSLPVWLRTGYQIQFHKFADNTRRELVDGLTVMLGVSTQH